MGIPGTLSEKLASVKLCLLWKPKHQCLVLSGAPEESTGQMRGEEVIVFFLFDFV